MDTDMLLLGIMIGLTLIGYMVAINSHGPIKLSFSYLMATVMLAATVWAIVDHYNTGVTSEQMQRLKTAEAEKREAEERLRNQELALRENTQRMQTATQLNSIISSGTALSTALSGADLQDVSVTLDVLMGRANSSQKRAKEVKERLDKIKTDDDYFSRALDLLREATGNLVEAGRYYSAYYHSEDPAQEQLRERVMRSKAKEAYQGFRRASDLIGMRR